jgi:hypothetical protein
MTFSSTCLVENDLIIVQQILAKPRNRIEICEKKSLKVMTCTNWHALSQL